MKHKPIPAVYTCYLLRSTSKPGAQPYIGSTPHPLRRWRQHNGLAQGGAKRTAKAAYRPWQMCMIVYGFPSKLAALQFEWAWQHTAATRHVRDSGYDHGVGSIGKSSKGKSRPTLNNKLSDLHALLHCSSFRRWPLGVRFFARDVHSIWTQICEKSSINISSKLLVVTVDSLAPPLPPRKSRANKIQDTEQVEETEETKPPADTAVQPPPSLLALDAGYAPLLPHLKKSMTILAFGSSLTCSVCEEQIKKEQDLVVVCSHHDCNALSHVLCMSQHCRNQETDSSDDILPISGSCPNCKRPVDWMSMVKESSVRTFDTALATTILKPRRSRKQPLALLDHGDGSSDDELSESDNDVAYEELIAADTVLQAEQPIAEVLDQQAQEQAENEEEASDSDALPQSGQLATAVSQNASMAKLEVPDSEWGNVEIVV